MISVSGAALTAYNHRTDGSSYRDWAAEAFEAALKMSMLEREDLDLLVVASESDFFTLQLNVAAVLASELGLAGAAVTRAEGGGASGQLAVHAGVNAILSGQARHACVVGVDPSASQVSGATARKLYGFSFDAWTEGMTGASATVLYALSAQRFMADEKLDQSHLAAVTVLNRNNALVNAKAHLGRAHTVEEIEASPAIALPYRRLHCSPLSDGAAAVILSNKQSAPHARQRAPRIKGIGAASANARLGARADVGRFTAKTRAMRNACKAADLTPQDIGLAEVYDAYAGAQLQALDALGLSDQISRDTETGAFAPAGRVPVNLSGGLMGQGAPAGAIGVGQTASCALFLEGRHHSSLQPSAPPAYALADTHGGICTTAAVTLLGQGDAA